MKFALTIAGSDPTGGAGLQVDLKVFHSQGLYGLSLPTALTAQSSGGVAGVLPVDPEFFSLQADTLLREIRPHAVKTGMLATAPLVEKVVALAEAGRFRNLVIDPVTVSSSGAQLLDDEGFRVLRDRLLPLCRVVTPNMAEAARLSGMPVTTEEDMEKAAALILGMGPAAVVITGGHLDGSRVANLLRTTEGDTWWRGGKHEGAFHGTGCAFSASIAANLALGARLPEALDRASHRIDAAIRTAITVKPESPQLLDP